MSNITLVNSSKKINPTESKMKIKIGESTFGATFYDNATANAFKKMLPLSVNMVELNGNEKYADLTHTLPANASNPGNIQNGDLMLYGSSTLVLFYKSFSTAYSYTLIAHIDDVTGLARALGSGNVQVTYILE
ncbi:MAG: cyclophilin-like fold protein [Nitrospira sp.]